jgi:Fe-S oxidoreductase
MNWQSIVFIIIAGAAFGYAGRRLNVLYRLMLAHSGTDDRLSEIPARIKTALVNVLGQKAVLRDWKPGLMHATIFWGFLIICVGTLEQFLSTIYAPLNFEFIGHAAYRAFVFIYDIFTLGVLVGVIYAFYRRVIVRPSQLGQSPDAIYILIFTGGLMIAIFLMNAFNVLAVDLWYKNAMPISLAIANMVERFGFSTETNGVLGLVFKWIHMLIVLGFLVYIPSSKHLHIIAAAPNTFFRTLTKQKSMKPINFEDESLEQYGTGKISDLTWKDALDYFSCTECGRCQAVCPAWNTDKPLSPKKLIIDLKHNLHGNQQHVLAKNRDEVSHVIDDHVTEDVIWACTSCRACESACPVFIEHTDKIYDIRRNLIMMESRFPHELQLIFKNMETNATPWQFSSAERADWAEGLAVKTMAEDSNVDVLYWVGCAGAYDDRNKKVARAFVNLLNKAGVRFSILGTEEQCTGDAARRVGNEYLFQMLAQANVETLNGYNVKQIVTACPHCFNTLKNEYPAFGGNYEVHHHSQFIARLITQGKLKPDKSLNETIAYHDSCYLGRWNDVYDDPRSVINAVSSKDVVELPDNLEKGMCCGAGGGRMWMEETIGKRVNVARTEQAIASEADVVGTACPFCATMITDGLKSKEKDESIKVMDIAELVDQHTR